MPHLGYTSDECVEYPVKGEELVVKWTLNVLLLEVFHITHLSMNLLKKRGNDTIYTRIEQLYFLF
jgi:hypothetical protein